MVYLHALIKKKKTKTKPHEYLSQLLKALHLCWSLVLLNMCV